MVARAAKPPRHDAIDIVYSLYSIGELVKGKSEPRSRACRGEAHADGVHARNRLQAQRRGDLACGEDVRLRGCSAQRRRTIRQMHDDLDAAVRKDRLGERGPRTFELPEAVHVGREVGGRMPFLIAHR